jgi:hypothetical protein
VERRRHRAQRESLAERRRLIELVFAEIRADRDGVTEPVLRDD